VHINILYIFFVEVIIKGNFHEYVMYYFVLLLVIIPLAYDKLKCENLLW
jgi:hypothetical protein